MSLLVVAWDRAKVCVCVLTALIDGGLHWLLLGLALLVALAGQGLPHGEELAMPRVRGVMPRGGVAPEGEQAVVEGAGHGPLVEQGAGAGGARGGAAVLQGLVDRRLLTEKNELGTIGTIFIPRKY